MNLDSNRHSNHLIVAIMGYGASYLSIFARILNEEASRYGFQCVVVNSDDSLNNLSDIEKADVIFIYSHELPREVEKSIEESRAIVIAVSESLLPLSRASPEALLKAAMFIKIGGEENLRGLAKLLLREAGVDLEVPEPKEVPWHGIYHPKLGYFDDLRRYLESYYHADKPLVCVMYHRTLWLYGLMEPIEKIVHVLEDEGLGVVPIFTCNFRDQRLNIERRENILRRFLFLDGKPVIDAFLDLTFFFPLGHGYGLEAVEGLRILKEINAPLICTVTSFYQSIDEWLQNPQGVDFLTQVYRVFMPEIDGGIEPIPLLFGRCESDGSKRYEAYDDHIKYIAKRIKRWIELKKKPPHERRVAIILINPPCKGLEATVGIGMGLDVPESVVRLLAKLKDAGYNVGDWIPSNGTELVKFILDRRAISEFRWTPIEEVVARGGAVGFVDLETYLKWFNELPEETRKKMIEVWGNPRELTQGNVREFAGMIYDGKFVIPGVLFGNILVMCQPKFGCAGPACDGKVCKILHDPLTPPPHQWLAAYRWVTRIFGADVIIHFGTHGYLEFRPGKGVGLSPLCWPEITVDYTPHLYVYNVSNPMEGVIAKRRSYATIIDHLHPPMSNAEVLDELDDLLNQYAKAKSLGDYERAKIILDELLDQAKKYNIPLGSQEPDEVVDAIHKYVSTIRNSQIEIGLHVFGHPPKDPDKLAEYVVTLMSYDTHSYPSILRVLAEAIGLNYDDLRNNPLNYNDELGLTNQEILNKLRVIAKSVLKKLLSRDHVDDDAIIKTINEEVTRCLGVK